MSVDLCFTFDVVNFGQHWHHLYSICAGGNGFFNDTQIRVLVEPEISMKMLRNLGKRLRAKLPATTRGYSMVKFARLDDAFSENLQMSKQWGFICEKLRKSMGSSRIVNQIIEI